MKKIITLMKKVLNMNRMKSLNVEGVKTYIGPKGKARALELPEGNLICCPLAPFPATDRISYIPPSNDETSMSNLIQKYHLRPFAISVSKDLLIGVWVRSRDLPYGYIPVKPVEIPEKLSELPINSPLLQDSSDSILSSTSKKSRIAYYLMQYALYECSRNLELYEKDPKLFARRTFKIREIQIPESAFNLKLGNPEFYSKGGRLILPSKEAQKKILRFLQISISNNRTRVVEFSERTYIEVTGRDTEFRRSPGTLVFTNTSTILNWISTKRSSKYRYRVFTKHQGSPRLEKIQGRYRIAQLSSPYFYVNNYVSNGRPVLVQNVFGGFLDLAIHVANVWKSEKVNIGYNGGIEGFGVLIWKERTEQVREMIAAGLPQEVLNNGLLNAVVGNKLDMIDLCISEGATNLNEAAAYASSNIRYLLARRKLEEYRIEFDGEIPDSIKRDAETLRLKRESESNLSATIYLKEGNILKVGNGKVEVNVVKIGDVKSSVPKKSSEPEVTRSIYSAYLFL